MSARKFKAVPPSGRESKPAPDRRNAVSVPLERVVLEFSTRYMSPGQGRQKGPILNGCTTSGAVMFNPECTRHEVDFGIYNGSGKSLYVPEAWHPLMTFDFAIKPERDGSLGYSMHLKNSYLDDYFWIVGVRVKRRNGGYISHWWDCPSCRTDGCPRSLLISPATAWVGCNYCIDERNYLEFYSPEIVAPAWGVQ